MKARRWSGSLVTVVTTLVTAPAELRPGAVGRKRRRPGIEHLQGQRIAVEAEEGGVATQRGEGLGLVGEGGEVPVLQGFDEGDGPAQPVMHGQQVEPTLLAGVPEQATDLLGRGDRLLFLVVAPTGCSAAWPDHVLSPDCPLGQAYLFTDAFRQNGWQAEPMRPHRRASCGPRSGMLRAQVVLHSIDRLGVVTKAEDPE